MLDLTKDIRPISYVKAHTAEMLRQVESEKHPVVITQNGEAKAVLLDIDTYQHLINSINLMKYVSIGERDINNGKTIKHSDLKEKIENLLV